MRKSKRLTCLVIYSIQSRRLMTLENILASYKKQVDWCDDMLRSSYSKRIKDRYAADRRFLVSKALDTIKLLYRKDNIKSLRRLKFLLQFFGYLD